MSPIRSRKQRAWLHKFKPELAEEFEKKTPKGKKLPVRVKKRRRQIRRK